MTQNAEYRHLRATLKQDPEDLQARLKVVGILTSQGQLNVLRQEITDALAVMGSHPLLPERYHKPVIKTLSENGLWQHVEMLCRHLEVTYAEDLDFDEALRRMIRKGRRLILQLCPVPFMDERVKGEEWWLTPDEAPEVYPGSDAEIQDSFRCYTKPHGEEDRLTLYIAGHEDDGYLNLLSAEMPLDEFHTNLGGGVVGANKRVGMVCYTNDETLYFFD